MPFLPLIYAELRKLPKEIEWEWAVMEGSAMPVHCTRWVKQINKRLSTDGTTDFLASVAEFDQRVKHYGKAGWEGKIEMVNWPLHAPHFDEEFLLWQIDSDEWWRAEQIAECRRMFLRDESKNAAYFWCNYYVGPDKVITTRNCFGNQSSYEWLRVWRVKPGMLFRTHEPPVIDGLKLNPFTHAETEARGLVFDHYSFATRAQVAFKQEFYAGPNNPNAKYYKGLTERWEKFQAEEVWPRSLNQLFPWVEPNCMVDRV